MADRGMVAELARDPRTRAVTFYDAIELAAIALDRETSGVQGRERHGRPSTRPVSQIYETAAGPWRFNSYDTRTCNRRIRWNDEQHYCWLVFIVS